MKKKTIEVYLEADRWNPVCQATIPGAWVAEIEAQNGQIVVQAFAHPEEFNTVKDAMIGAKKILF